MSEKREWLTKDVIAVEVVAWVLCAIAVVAFGVWFSGASDFVPVHYGLDGIPDRWGSPKELLLLPFFIIVSNALMSLILHLVDPRYWNRPGTLREGEEQAWYLASARVLVWIELEIAAYGLALLSGTFSGSFDFAMPLTIALVVALAISAAVPCARFYIGRSKAE